MYRERCFCPRPVAGMGDEARSASILLPLVPSACLPHQFSSLNSCLTNLSYSAVRAWRSSRLPSFYQSTTDRSTTSCPLPAHSLTGCTIWSKSLPLPEYSPHSSTEELPQPFQFCYSVIILFCRLIIFQVSQVSHKTPTKTKDCQSTVVFISFHEANKQHTQCSVVNFLAVISCIHLSFNAFTTKDTFQGIRFHVSNNSESLKVLEGLGSFYQAFKITKLHLVNIS